MRKRAHRMQAAPALGASTSGTIERLACFTLVLALASCGGGSVSHPPQPLRPAPTGGPTIASAKADEPGCAEAGRLLAKMRAAEATKDPRCAHQAGRRARSLCPTLTEPSADLLTREEDLLRGAHGDVTALGPWLIEHTSTESRVWSVSPEGPKLPARIDGSEFTVVKGNAIRARVGDDLYFVDPTTASVAHVAAKEVVAEQADYLFAETDTEVRRLALPKLETTGVVAWSNPATPSGLATSLRGGAVLVTDGALISFDAKTVRSTGLTLIAPSADEAHLLGCDPASSSLVDLDVTTGAELGRVAIPGATACPERVAYAPDPRFAFWVEQGAESKSAGAKLIVVVADFQTGRTSRFDDPQDTWSIAFNGRPYIEAGHLCVNLASFHGSWNLCDWKLDAKGRIGRDPKTVAPLDSPPVGPGGEIELGRLDIPKTDRRLVLSFREKGEIKTDLRLSVFRGRKLERGVSLVPGELFFDDTALREAWRAHEYSELPRIAPLDDNHVVILRGTGSLTDMVVDLDSGSVREPCKDLDDCSVVGRYAVDSKKGVIMDVLTSASMSLEPSTIDWSTAPHVEEPCP